VQNGHLHRQYEAAKARLKLSGHTLYKDVVVYHGTRVIRPHHVHAGTKGFDPARGKALPG